MKGVGVYLVTSGDVVGETFCRWAIPTNINQQKTLNLQPTRFRHTRVSPRQVTAFDLRTRHATRIMLKWLVCQNARITPHHNLGNIN